MQVITQIIRLLNKPFPLEESLLGTFKIITAISVFVVLFLYIFEPFGLHLLESGLFLFCLGFGGVAFITSLAYELLIVFVVKLKGAHANFTFAKWIAYFTGAMLFISLANFLYARWVLFGDIQWSLLPHMMRGTFAIGFFPTVVIAAIALLQQERKYQKIAAELNHQDELSNVHIETDKRIFDIPITRIKFIEAMQNYVQIHHLDNNGQVKIQTERATIKSLLDQSQNSSIIRCHRSFLVNRDSVISSSGNAQGLLLSLTNYPIQVPVSRSYVKDFR